MSESPPPTYEDLTTTLTTTITTLRTVLEVNPLPSALQEERSKQVAEILLPALSAIDSVVKARTEGRELEGSAAAFTKKLYEFRMYKMDAEYMLSEWRWDEGGRGFVRR